MNFREAANAAGKLQAFIDLLARSKDVLETAAGVESKIDASNAALMAANDSLKAVNDSIAAAKQELEELSSKSSSAKKKRDELLSAAQSKADDIVAAANQAAAAIYSNSESVQASISQSKAELDSLKMQIASAQKEFEREQKRIAEIKAAALAALS